MKIVDVKWEKFKIELESPFKIALGTSYYHEGVLLKIITDEGIKGIGEAAPSERITGETTDTVCSVLNLFKNYLIGKNPLEIQKIMDDLNQMLLHNTSAKCAVDIALWDIKAKYFGLPLRDLLGKDKEKITTSITIGIKSIEETIKEAQEIIKRFGAKVLKIKVGLNLKEDIEKIKELRDAIGYDVKIRVDANQGYNLKEAVKFAKEVEKYEIELFEQPLPYYQLNELRILRDKIGIPVMLDESVHTARDALKVIKENCCDVINIKLMKSGGICEALKIASIAESAGIPCMVGCMVETRIGVSAGTHFALSVKNVKYADLDGHLFLKKDIAEGGVITKEGENYITENKGLGVEF